MEEESEASTQATADPDDERAHDLRRGEYDRGICLRGEDGGDHAIPQDDEDSRWPAPSARRGSTRCSTRCTAGATAGRGSTAAHGVGWIHLRFPVVDGLLWTPPDADSVTRRHGHHRHPPSTSTSTSTATSASTHLRSLCPRASGTSTATRTASTPSSLWSSSRS